LPIVKFNAAIEKLRMLHDMNFAILI
jgi:hypothetical protein